MTADIADAPPTIDPAAALQAVFEALNQIGMIAAEILSSRPACIACFNDRAAAQRMGVAADKLPPLNAVALILDGKGVCAGHVRVGSRIILPGQG